MIRSYFMHIDGERYSVSEPHALWLMARARKQPTLLPAEYRHLYYDNDAFPMDRDTVDADFAGYQRDNKEYSIEVENHREVCSKSNGLPLSTSLQEWLDLNTTVTVCNRCEQVLAMEGAEQG